MCIRISQYFENERANVSLTLSINFHYGLWVAISLVGATPTTMFCMVIVELLLQLNMSYEIVKQHRKIHDQEQATLNKRKAVLKLLLAELSEGLVPLAYAICFSMALYGPNAKLIGNVGNGYWQYKAVDDASLTFLVMFGLFAFDLVCSLMNSIIIWVFSNVNLFDEFCSIMQKYWYITALKMTNNICHHFFGKDINLANDWTLKFAWIAKNENFSTMSNSTYL